MENKSKVGIKFEFRGFRLIKAEYNHLEDIPFNGFTLSTTKHLYDEKNQILELITEVEIRTAKEKSFFAFSSGYKVLDTEWYEVMAEPTVINACFKTFYPYIREKVQTITSDFRPGFLLPVIDMEMFDFSKQITFNFEKPKEADVKIETDMIN